MMATWGFGHGIPVLIQKYFGWIVLGIGAAEPFEGTVTGGLNAGFGRQTGSLPSPSVVSGSTGPSHRSW